MSADQLDSVTGLLQAAREGDDSAFDELYARVYDELRRLARVVRRGRAAPTLNTTALVNEAYLHLLPSANLTWQDRAHFFRVAARAMRQVLVQTARRRMAQKRGGGAEQVTFNEHVHGLTVNFEDILSLEKALQQLESLDQRQASVVECRYYAGLTIEETAATLGVAEATVKRDWRAARAFLTNALVS
jgi:RNA polymerase sigma factor (TIGR02999 family)